jgi:sugar lactone lactonase YvrE
MDRRRALFLVLRALAVCGLALVVTWLAMPSPIGSLAWIPSPAPALDGAFKMNTLLQTTTSRFPDVIGAEDLAFDADGRIYTGLADGRIVRLEGDAVVEVVNTGGRPLGLAFSPKDGLLYVADAKRGLLRVDPATRQVEVLVRTAEGFDFRCVNEVVVASDGTVYFTDSSAVWGIDQLLEELLDQRPTGRVIRYDPTTKAVTVLVRELSFANGLAIAPDEKSLIIAETGRYRLWRLFLDGDKRNLKEVLVENLPGFPDNLSVSPRGTVWVALNSTRKRILDAIHPHPFFKDAVATLPPGLRPQFVRWGFVLEIDADGRPLRSLQDPDGDVVPHVTTAVEHEGTLWLGSLDGPGIKSVPLPPP